MVEIKRHCQLVTDARNRVEFVHTTGEVLPCLFVEQEAIQRSRHLRRDDLQYIKVFACVIAVYTVGNA